MAPSGNANPSGLDAAPGLGATESSFTTSQRGTRFGRANGRSLDNILLSNGRVLARADGSFRDLVVVDGQLGHVSRGKWNEFPKETLAQLVSFVGSSPELANSKLGKEVLETYGEDGIRKSGEPSIKTDTIIATGSTSAGDVWARNNEPILGKGLDNVFRPITVRSDGSVGYWNNGNWTDFPEGVKDALKQVVRAQGQQSPAAKWLFGATRPDRAPARAETLEERSPPPATNEGEHPAPTPSTHGTEEALQPSDSGGRAIAPNPFRKADLLPFLARRSNVFAPSPVEITEAELASKYGTTEQELRGDDNWKWDCNDDGCLYERLDPESGKKTGQRFFLKKENGGDPEENKKVEEPADAEEERTEPEQPAKPTFPTSQVLKFEELGLGAPSPEAIKALQERMGSKQLHIVFTSYAKSGEDGYCNPCDRFKRTGDYEKFAGNSGSTFVTIDSRTMLSGGAPQGLERLWSRYNIEGIPNGVILEKNGSGGWNEFYNKAPVLNGSQWSYPQNFLGSRF